MAAFHLALLVLVHVYAVIIAGVATTAVHRPSAEVGTRAWSWSTGPVNPSSIQVNGSDLISVQMPKENAVTTAFTTKDGISGELAITPELGDNEHPGLTLCDDAAFGGKCTHVTISVPVCAQLSAGKGDMIASVTTHPNSRCVIFSGDSCDGHFVLVDAASKAERSVDADKGSFGSFVCRSAADAQPVSSVLELRDDSITEDPLSSIDPEVAQAQALAIVTVCTEINFYGRCWRILVQGCHTMLPKNRNLVSSMVPYPGVKCTVYDGNNCSGASRHIAQSWGYMTGFTNRMNSLRCSAS